MPNDKILELAKKLKALADRGMGGEQKNAVAKLRALLAKHGLTEADLENEKIAPEAFSYKSDEKNILSHIIWKVCGGQTTIYGSKRKHNEFIVDCTHAQKVEILAMQDLYRQAFKKELSLFIVAFILKNGLSADGDPGQQERSRHTDEEKHKIRKMMNGIDPPKAYKQLEG